MSYQFQFLIKSVPVTVLKALAFNDLLPTILFNGVAKVFRVLIGTIKLDGAWLIELLITTDKKLFYEAVYPTLANDELRIAAFKAMNNVDVEAGYEA